ncbi:alpha/beta hydrolase fold family protein [Mycobacterium xenopi 3993]|nr:alpha/beta hydrolase fold family protein [Mycobacterium xenopi 3993]
MPAMQQPAQRFVDSADGIRIAVYEEGNRDGPTVVLVHGWPDSHVLWDGVVPLLADRFRVIRYDNRGVGASAAPKPASAYTMARFADDFAAVIDACSPTGRCTRWPTTGDRSGLGVPAPPRRPRPGRLVHFAVRPSQHHLVDYIFSGLRRPYHPRAFVRALSQALRLSYMAVFSIPLLAPLIVRLALSSKAIRRRLVEGIPGEQVHHSPSLARDAAYSVKTYRANYFRSFAGARRDHYVAVPVQLIVNTEDPYVRPYGYDATARWVPRLWRRDIKAGHWSPMSHPQVLASAVHELVDYLDGKPPSRALLRAEVRRSRKCFGDMLVAVTGQAAASAAQPR